MLSEDTLKAKRAKRGKKPKHKTVTRAYDFVMEVSPRQNDRLMKWMAACWRLRNNLVADRIENRQANKLLKQQGSKDVHYLTCSDQYADISKYAKKDTGLSLVHSQVRQNVAVRVDEGYKRFFDALKEGRSDVHPPHFIDFKKYRSLTFPQYGFAARIKNSKLYLSGLGVFGLFDHRKIKGKPKTVTIKFKQGRWHCIITAEAQEKDIMPAIAVNDERPDTGIDTGIENLMVDSFGKQYDPPKAWYDYRRKLKTAQKKLSRQFAARKKTHEALAVKAKGEGKAVPSIKDIPISNRLKAQSKKVAKIHTKIENIRDYHHKKNTSVIADIYRNVAVEEHGVNFMIRNKRLAKAAADRAIHKQKLLLQSKLGKRYIKVSNKREGIGGNSQSCTCGAAVPKTLKDRIHKCPECGLTAKRDHVSANIVSIIAFGFCSLSLSEAGQVFVRRGEDKALTGESLLRESQLIEAKRQPPVQEQNTTDAEAAVEGETRWHHQDIGVAA